MLISGYGYDPIKETFKDLSLWKLICSSLRVFWRIKMSQGWSGACRVIPIIWTLIYTVKGFARYHQAEFEKMLKEFENEHEPVPDEEDTYYMDVQLNKSTDKPIDSEAEALSAEEYEEYRRLGSWLREKLTNLGPTFIKIGQTLSTRADLVPLPTMLELSTLQESVEACPLEKCLDMIKRDLGASPESLFQHFDTSPIAAASLSQAYKAILKDGRDVVVKVQRPNLTKIITQDVETLAAIADEVMRYPSMCRHTDWPAVVEEFARTIFEEIDYIKEGRNADRFRHNFRDNEHIFIPRIIWKLTGRHVLTVEYVPGARITDEDALEQAGIDRQKLTVIGVNFYLKQLLEDGFFHADPHPGNMRIMPDGKIGVFDFGMVGRISQDLKQSMANAFMHVVKKDYSQIVDDFVDMGFLPQDVDRDSFCQEMIPILEARFNEGISKIRFRKVLFDFSDLVYRYPFKLPSEFTYIMRALLTLEGVALAINPQFNFVDAAMPFAQRLIWKESGSGIRQAILKEVFSEGKFNAQAAISLVKSAYKLSKST